MIITAKVSNCNTSTNWIQSYLLSNLKFTYRYVILYGRVGKMYLTLLTVKTGFKLYKAKIKLFSEVNTYQVLVLKSPSIYHFAVALYKFCFNKT